jgi:PAS domain S-box-containing protein
MGVPPKLKKILLLEDNPGDAQLVQEHLAVSPANPRFAVEWVQTLEAAEYTLGRQSIDMVLLDLNLPDSHGLETFERIRTLAPRTPAVILTGVDDQEMGETAVREGAQDYLSKSALNEKNLNAALRYALERHRSTLKLGHLNAMLRTVRKINKLITQEHEPDRILAGACRHLVEDRGFAFAWALELNEQGQPLRVSNAGQTSQRETFRRKLTQNELPPCGDLARKCNHTQLVKPRDPICDRCLLGAELSCHGAIVTPMKRADTHRGLLGVAVPEAIETSAEEQYLFEEVAGDIAFALYSAEREAALTRSQERYRRLFEGMKDAVFIHGIEKDGRPGPFVEVNEAACKRLGYSRQQLLSMSVYEIDLPGWQKNIPAIMERLADEGRAVFETAHVPQSGDAIPVEVNCHRFELDGAPMLLSIVRDIRKRKKAEKEKTRLEQELRQAQKMEAIGRLAGGVAHDFNNVLSIIIGYCGLMQRSIKKADPLQEDLDQVLEAAERAASLTRQLLAFSRRQFLEPKVISLNTVIANMEDMVQRLIGEDIILETALAENLGWIMADPGQIEQVVMNLAVNARDAMAKGGRLTLETTDFELGADIVRRHPSGLTPGPHVMLAVSDTGHGMDAETRARIFEPFFTTKEKGKGTGLGLSTVYGIVKQSGGDIWIYSEPGHGTTFKILFPRTGAQQTRPAQSTKTPLRRGSETVLVVEDEPDLLKLMCRILENQGYKTLPARHGGEALILAEKYPAAIDLLITDVVMPEMSGKDLADRLTGMDADLKVLYTSGYTDNAIVHHGVLDDETDFIQKPFDREEFLRKIQRVITDKT